MKICWNNLEKLRYIKEKGIWKDITTKATIKYRYVNSCKKCGIEFLAQIQSKGKFCSHSCRGKETAKLNLSYDKRGKNNPMFGRTHSKKSKDKISKSRIGKYTLEKHPRWKKGIKISKGYVMYKMPNHPNSNGYGYVMEHRLAMEKEIGRLLEQNEEVHHKNGIRDDNRIENLELWHKGHPGGQKVSDLIQYYLNFLYKYDKTLLSNKGKKLRSCEI
jgi:hypothetical protein